MDLEQWVSVDKVLRLGGINQNRVVNPCVLLVQLTNGRKREIQYSVKNLRGTEKWADICGPRHNMSVE